MSAVKKSKLMNSTDRWIERIVWAGISEQTEKGYTVTDPKKLIRRLKALSLRTLKLAISEHSKSYVIDTQLGKEKTLTPETKV